MYQIVRALSLDVVLGAVISSLFLANYLQVRLSPVTLYALALAVWVVYTADHLWDAQKLGSSAQSFRHKFHQKHSRILRIALVLATIIGVLLMPLLPKSTMICGVIISLLVLVYFLVLRFIGSTPNSVKEIMVSLVYSFGVFAAPWSLAYFQISPPLVLIFVQFTLIALVNLLEFSYFELELDRRHHFGSAVLLWGRSLTKKIVLWSLCTVLGLAAISYLIWPEYNINTKSQLVLALMAVTLAIIILRPAYFKNSERFRMVGDSIFFFPSMLLL